ncbi:MAG: hypothetical protein JNK55_01050 [Rubrivivax sp.]|nr:hypothetical protein [Rubrivivax sp.]
MPSPVLSQAAQINLSDKPIELDTITTWHIEQMKAAVAGAMALLPKAPDLRALAVDDSSPAYSMAINVGIARSLLEGAAAHAEDLGGGIDELIEDVRAVAAQPTLSY